MIRRPRVIPLTGDSFQQLGGVFAELGVFKAFVVQNGLSHQRLQLPIVEQRQFGYDLLNAICRGKEAVWVS